MIKYRIKETSICKKGGLHMRYVFPILLRAGWRCGRM